MSNSHVELKVLYKINDINYKITFVSGYYIDLSIEKLQIFPVRVNPDR